MEKQNIVLLIAVTAAITLIAWHRPSLWADEQSDKFKMIWDFENLDSGQIPTGWKIESTNPEGPLATWKVIEIASAPSGKKVFGMTSPNHSSEDTFNICWNNFISLYNGVIEVSFKADSGIVDQGGGLIWRALDNDNYYIARYNPLEQNFRIYHVQDGFRTKIADTWIQLPAGVWHKLKITHFDTKIEGYLNGRKLLEVTDKTFVASGGIGLWTKADAETVFDDLVINSGK
jgi:hypothetical protein